MRLAILALFFGSGFSSLVYEVLWTRRLSLTLGHTVWALSLVVTAFMLGLAVGSLLGGRRADRSTTRGECLKAYGQLELAIGGWALASPFLLALVERLYYGYGFWSGAAGAVLVLLPPTAAMGATLPIMSRMLADEPESVGMGLSHLYGSNTLGACAGACAAGWWMLPALGMAIALGATAFLNLSLGVLAWALSVFLPEPLAERNGEPPSPVRALRLSLAMGLAGVASMGLQLSWTRSLALVMGSSTYAFSTTLAVFLVGLGAGSAVLGWFRFARTPTRGQLGAMLLLTGLMAALSYQTLSFMPLLAEEVKPMHAPSLLTMLSSAAMLAAMVVLPATLLMGAALPLASTLQVHQLGPVGRSLASVYSANTAGCILGAALTGLVLMPQLGVQLTLKLSAGLYLAAALLVTLRPLALLPALALGLGIAWLPPWNLARLQSGPGLYDRAALPDAPAFYRDGLSSTVSVEVDAEGVMSLRVNGKVDASLHPLDLGTQNLLGYVPGFLHKNPRRVAVIGLGTGLTVRALANFPEVEQLDVVELEPAVVEAGKLWAGYNGRVLEDPRVRLHLCDGRNFVHTAEGKLDLIVSEPSNPWIAGVGSLYTLEFYRACRDRLEPDGIMAQWFHLYGISESELARVLCTFYAIFPEGGVWETGPGDILLIGSQKPVALDLDRVRAVLSGSHDARRSLTNLELFAPESVAGLYLLDRGAALSLLPTDLLNTDDRPMLEFMAPLSFGRPGLDSLNRELLLTVRGTEPLLAPGVERTPANLTRAAQAWVRMQRHADAFRALAALKDEPGARLAMARSADLQSDARAEQLYKQALEDAPGDPATLWQVSRYLMGRGMHGAAEPILARLAEIGMAGFEEQVLVELARVLSELGRNLEALARLEQATRLPTASHISWLAKGNLERHLGRSQEALTCLEQALELNSASLGARLALAETLTSLKLWEEAARAWEGVLELKPDQASAWNHLARCLRELGRGDEARQAFQQVRMLQPEHP